MDTIDIPGPDYPACCYATDPNDLAQAMYAHYNRGGDTATAGLNFQGAPCPTWEQLPPNIRAKWVAAAAYARNLLAGPVPT